MNKSQLITSIAQNAGLTQKKSELAINAIISVITDALSKKDKVLLVGFGSFETKKRAAKKGNNMHTGKIIDIPETMVPVFKASKNLKDAVNNGGNE